MAKRVEKIFEDIKTLSKEEQKELLRLLPKAFDVTPDDLLWARLAESSFNSGRIPRTKSTMSFDRGDVVLVPFPFTDLTTQKQRPGLVISSKSFNDSSPDAILLAITSQVPTDLQHSDYHLSVDEQKKGGLPKPSVVKAAKVVTLSQALIRKPLGRLPVETVDQIVRRLVSVIG